MHVDLIAAINRLTVDDLHVLYEDEAILVVQKPAGMLTHRGWGNDKVTAVDLVKAYLDVDTAYPGHRLDRPTSGPIVFAKDAFYARRVGEAFMAREVDKRYLALTRGITEESGVIDHPIPRTHKGERAPSVTEYRRLATFERYSLVTASPKTGRLHQVRRHFKHISHPLIGDTKYGKGEHNRLHRQRFNLHRLALHSWFLGFEHPMSGERIGIVAEVPEDLSGPFERMGLEPVWEPLLAAERQAATP